MASREVRNVSKDELKEKGRMVRRAVLRMTDICGSGHYGSAYSMTELVNNAGWCWTVFPWAGPVGRKT